MLSALLFLLLRKILVIEKTIINVKIDAIKNVNELNVIKKILLCIRYLNNISSQIGTLYKNFKSDFAIIKKLIFINIKNFF